MLYSKNNTVKSKWETQSRDLLIPSCRLSSQKIGFVADVDPFHDKKAWSGTIYKLCEAIQLAGYDVIWIPYRRTGFQHWLLKKYYKLFWVKRSCVTKTRLSTDSVQKRLIMLC